MKAKIILEFMLNQFTNGVAIVYLAGVIYTQGMNNQVFSSDYKKYVDFTQEASVIMLLYLSGKTPGEIFKKIRGDTSEDDQKKSEDAVK